LSDPHVERLQKLERDIGVFALESLFLKSLSGKIMRLGKFLRARAS
jgi:hypothetical protein